MTGEPEWYLAALDRLDMMSDQGTASRARARLRERLARWEQRQIRESLTDAASRMEDVTTALERQHTSGVQTRETMERLREGMADLRERLELDSSSGEQPLPDRRQTPPATLWEVVRENPWVLVVIVALLGAFALVGVRIAVPWLPSAQPPPSLESPSEPSP